MANEVEICNLALSHLSAARIQSLDDRTKGAYECKLHYPVMRDAVLRDHQWNFATKREVLALETVTYSGWAYAYAYPVDCIEARELYDAGQGLRTNQKIPFEVALNSAKNRRLVLTDQDAAELIYTARVTDANMFDPLFVMALSYALASELAISIKGDPKLAELMTQTYRRQVGRAMAKNSNERAGPIDQTSPYVSARY
jgi:hypothetical protein